MTRSEYVSTLPPWRRLLATLNWRPVYDIEQRTRQLRIESLESEKLSKQLESEFEQRELERDKRLKLLRKENERLAALESRLDALLLNADSSSQTPPATDSN
jgi:flagellar motility protein MotE (MotC chaperone)